VCSMQRRHRGAEREPVCGGGAKLPRPEVVEAAGVEPPTQRVNASQHPYALVIPSRGDISNDVGGVKTHTVSAQAAGAGSHQPRVGGGSRAATDERSRVSTPQRSKSLTTSVTVLPTKHLFGHDGP